MSCLVIIPSRPCCAEGRITLASHSPSGSTRTHDTGHSHWSTSAAAIASRLSGFSLPASMACFCRLIAASCWRAMVRLSLGLVTSCRGMSTYALSCAERETAWSDGGRSFSWIRTVTETFGFLLHATRSAAAAARQPSSLIANRSSCRLVLRKVYAAVSLGQPHPSIQRALNADMSAFVIVAFCLHRLRNTRDRRNRAGDSARAWYAMDSWCSRWSCSRAVAAAFSLAAAFADSSAPSVFAASAAAAAFSLAALVAFDAAIAAS
mmetsp:Transcript_3301/g.14389  ORF Transcript_3301/g.14389 Transcript_3301/m.14389 type:complete len:264 (+) Transcript_3301:836-1627(+)